MKKRLLKWVLVFVVTLLICIVANAFFKDCERALNLTAGLVGLAALYCLFRGPVDLRASTFVAVAALSFIFFPNDLFIAILLLGYSVGALFFSVYDPLQQSDARIGKKLFLITSNIALFPALYLPVFYYCNY